MSSPTGGSGSSRAGRTAARVALVAIVLLGLVGLDTLASRFGAPVSPLDPSASAIVPSVPDIPPPAITATPVITAPATIDATGGSDVTDDLQAFLDDVPNGSHVRLAAGGRYRVDGTLRLERRSDLDLDGAGATIEATTLVDANRRNLYLKDARRIMIHDLVIRGVNPEPGLLDEDHQFEHGIWLDGGADITIERVTIENPRGDCLYLGVADGTLPWVERVNFLDSECRGAGRNGVAIVGARDVRIEGNTFEAIGLHVVDLEPNRTDGQEGTPARPVQGARDVAVLDNLAIGPVAQYFVAANGWGEIDALSVVGNRLQGVALRITVQPLEESGYVRTQVLVRGNRSDTVYDAGRNGAAMRFTRSIDLTVRDNHGIVAGDGAALIEIQSSCRVNIGGNTFSGIERELRGEPGACPVVTAAAYEVLDVVP